MTNCRVQLTQLVMLRMRVMRRHRQRQRMIDQRVMATVQIIDDYHASAVSAGSASSADVDASASAGDDSTSVHADGTLSEGGINHYDVVGAGTTGYGRHDRHIFVIFVRRRRLSASGSSTVNVLPF